MRRSIYLFPLLTILFVFSIGAQHSYACVNSYDEAGGGCVTSSCGVSCDGGGGVVLLQARTISPESQNADRAHLCLYTVDNRQEQMHKWRPASDIADPRNRHLAIVFLDFQFKESLRERQ